MLLVQLLKAFVVGGIICAIGQVLIDYTKLTPARILVSFVVLGVVLGGIGLYQPLIDFAGSGASVPLLGFGALLAPGRAGGYGRKGSAWRPVRRAYSHGGRHHGSHGAQYAGRPHL
jgi:stage V sporulation protein AE